MSTVRDFLLCPLKAIALRPDEQCHDLEGQVPSRYDASNSSKRDRQLFTRLNHGDCDCNTNVSESLPPDLALEVDIASSSASKMTIYQAMGVAEVWLYRRNVLKIQLLQDGQYINVANGRAFPTVSVDQLNQWIELRKTETDLTVLRDVQQFCRNCVDESRNLHR